MMLFRSITMMLLTMKLEGLFKNMVLVVIIKSGWYVTHYEVGRAFQEYGLSRYYKIRLVWAINPLCARSY